ncbi:TPA: hypothetical protein I7C74_003324 [Vibrio cholerae]|nr:hypothetical protein [Vibrio cholerae]HAS4975630.1 hypothetical protein [Vibrio cholerae]HAS4987127.1 hypothetical protein [Vibrio cholerae]HAS4990974.1 hypothetical protein [Vibrio cholerae]HAS5006389.1 hypothetical protein [Vibrio cholerae]
MKNLLVSTLIGAFLLGCASQEYNDNLEFNNKIHKQITDATTYTKKEKVEFISKPPTIVSPVTDKPNQSWMNDPVTVNVVDMPLSVVLEEIMAGIDVPIFFSEKVKPNKPVTLNFSNSRKNVLNLLSRESGYGIEIKNGRLEVTDTVTRTFFLKLPVGNPNAQLGSQGKTSATDSTRIEGQFINVKYNEVNVTQEIADNIVNLLGGTEESKKAVSVALSMSSITVSATPDQMQMVERLIDEYQRELEKQVLLEMQVINFRSNLGTERGVDWNIVRDTGDGLLKFVLPGTNTVSQGSSYGLAFEGTGKWSGTEALIKVLQKQGTVTTSTPVTAVILNNQLGHLTQMTKVPFVSEVTSNSSEGVTSNGFTRGEEMQGVDFMAVANVQPEHVWLRLSGRLQAIVNTENREVAGIEAGFLTTEVAQITFANKVRYGQTLVIASVKQNARSTSKVTNFMTTLFGGTGSTNDVVETIVVLTPRKL